MKISKLARREAKRFFQACFTDGVLDEGRVKQVVEAVAKGKPRGWQAILSHFQRLLTLEVDRTTARVESATPLDDSQKAELEKRLTGIYGAGVQFQFTETPGLLGGLRVRVGSDVYDGSVEARLASLESSFSQ